MQPSFDDLFTTLIAQYDLGELRALCAKLGVDFDSLRGEGKAGKARELILFMQRHGRTNELAAQSKCISDSPALDVNANAKYTIHIEHASGNAIGDGAQVIYGGQAQRKSDPPAVSYSLLTRYFPTPYCYQLTAEQFPWFNVRLDNTGQGHTNAKIEIQATIEGYSDAATNSLLVAQGQLMTVSLLPLVQPAKMAALHEIRPATLSVTVRQQDDGERVLLAKTERVYLLARDTALLAIRSRDGGIVDLSDYLTAWVTPHHPEIEKFLRRAAEHHPDKQFVGYQGGATTRQRREIVRQQVRAIFDALKHDANLKYINSTLALGEQEGQIVQRVRLPNEALAVGGAANCLDGTALFASLLELASLEPMLVLVPGHAFVGWRVWEGVNNYEFVETTMVGSDDFEAAQNFARQQYADALERGYFTRGLFDPGGFARLIDVVACHTNGIMPLR